MASRRWSRLAGTAAVIGALVASPDPASARTVNDPALGDQWGIAKVGAPRAWDVATGAGTVIAVVDSGVDLGHEDLVAKLLPGRDFTGKGSVQDDCGHGTHVSGIAAAATNNGRGVAGVAPDARILPVKALYADGPDCVGNSDEVGAGIRWAADQKATVINLSLGSDIQFLLGSGLEDDIAYAWNKGSVVVVAAGNQYILGSGYSDQPAIVVTATDPSDRKPSYSSSTGGARWAMSAPGGAGCGCEDDVLSTYWERGKKNLYAHAAGTSMATPFVAGAAAVLRSTGLSPQQTVDRLLATATDLGAKGADGTYGAGRLDLAKAVGSPAPPAAGGGGAPTPVGGGGSSGSAGSPATTARRGGGGSGGGTASPSRPAGSSSGADPGIAAPGAAAPVASDVTAAPLDLPELDAPQLRQEVVLEDAGTAAPDDGSTARLVTGVAAGGTLAAAAVATALAARRRRSSSPAG